MARVRSDISKKRPYWLEKHRLYELKYFCWQYPIWKRAYYSLDGLSKQPGMYIHTNGHSDPTERCVETRLYLKKKMDLVENVAKLVCPECSDAILVGVTTKYSYDQLKARFDFDLSKRKYYELYHKFFYILNEKQREALSKEV